ncbi:CPBP family intramembrane glutamic endopeptidase [Micromonospora coxensis]|uniref:Membrane protease YdiL, CAAX protease family n=1 Tax=Micromonospora coxensis TaxID=356852 RepID=A0A1C5HJJ5_9ACTN|nr:CPBP family intramembrane glutamic endopeptidase [Micromonospora coxensis]SCG46103.1 Membrane protease YdiL, CAAX protease family [Micromonospora coxensis]
MAGLGAVLAAALWLAATGNGGIRYSADHGDTVPMWTRWIPALVGIALIRLVPPRTDPRWPDPVAPYREAVPLLLAGIAFAAVLPLLGGEPAYTVGKLALLLGVPAVVFLAARRRPPRWRPGPDPTGAAYRWGPALPVAGWLVLSYATPLAVPASDWGRTVTPAELIATILVAFAVNALLEEVFYRRWLQTRWESLLGRWPAVVLASLVWAVWHVTIQGTGRLGTDLAAVVVNQGVLGLFLGYLWSRYRRMWPLLVVHGAVNAVPILLGL